MRQRATALVGLGVALLLAAPAWAATPAVAVGGADRARILPPPGATVEPYAGVGYRLVLEDGVARVEVEASPLGSRAAYAAPARWTDDAVGRLARARVAGAVSEYEATSRILDWVARNVSYDLDRTAPQDPLAVLARRSGYCTGVARLTVALLAAAGIPAREVAGYVAADDVVRGYHRWIEVWIRDRGWVMSDPLRSHHFVPASYLRLASERLTVAAGLDGLLLARHDEVVALDLEPGAAPGVRLRRNDDRQRAAALRVEVPSVETGSAVLEGRDRRRSVALASGGATFLGLPGGDYRLRILWAGGELERQVTVAARSRIAVRIAPLLPSPLAAAHLTSHLTSPAGASP